MAQIASIVGTARREDLPDSGRARGAQVSPLGMGANPGLSDLGAGITRAGEALAQAAIAYKRDQDQLREYDNQIGFDRLGMQMQEAFNEQTQNMSGSGNGFTRDFMAQYRERAAEWLGTLQEGDRKRWEARIEHQTRQMAQSAFAAEQAQRNRYYTNTNSEHLDVLRSGIDQNPAAIEAYRARGEEIIRASGLSESAKEEAISRWRDAADTAYGVALTRNNPDAVAGALGGDARYFRTARSSESSGNDNARNPDPRSTSRGRYGFTDDTWKDTVNSPEGRAAGLTLEGRGNPAQEEAAMRIFTAQSQRRLAAAGLPATEKNLYMLHFLGQSGGTSLLRQIQEGKGDNSAAAAFPAAAEMNRSDFYTDRGRGPARTLRELFEHKTKQFGTNVVGAPGSDPVLERLPYQARQSLRERADREITQQIIEAAQQVAAREDEMFNDLLLGIRRGDKGAADIEAGIQAGWLRRADRVAGADEKVERRDRTATNRRVNDLFVSLMDGTAATEAIERGRREGWLTDAGQIAQAQNIVERKRSIDKNDKVNQLLVGLINGTASEEDIATGQREGWLSDASSLSQAKGILDRRNKGDKDERVNQLFVSLIDRTADETEIERGRREGWLTDAGQIAQAQNIISRHRKDDEDKQFNQLQLDILDGHPDPEGRVEDARRNGLIDAGRIGQAYRLVEEQKRAQFHLNYGYSKLNNQNAVWNFADENDKRAVEAMVLAEGGSAESAFNMWQRTGILAKSGATALRGAIASTDVPRMTTALQIASNMMEPQPNGRGGGNVFAGVEGREEIESAAMEFRRLLDHNIVDNAEQAARRIMQWNDPAVRQSATQIDKAFDEYKKTYFTTQRASAEVSGLFSSWFGLAGPNTHPGMRVTAAQDYVELVQDAYRQTNGRDLAAAKNIAQRRLQNMYGVSNGYVVRYPPERGYHPSDDPANPFGYIYRQALERARAERPGEKIEQSDILLILPPRNLQNRDAWINRERPEYQIHLGGKDASGYPRHDIVAMDFRADLDKERQRLSAERQAMFDAARAPAAPPARVTAADVSPNRVFRGPGGERGPLTDAERQAEADRRNAITDRATERTTRLLQENQRALDEKSAAQRQRQEVVQRPAQPAPAPQAPWTAADVPERTPVAPGRLRTRTRTEEERQQIADEWNRAGKRR